MPGRAEGLRDVLASVIFIVKAAAGCRRCELAVDLEDQARLLIVEARDRTASCRASDCNEEFR